MRIAVRHEEFHPERTLICSSQRERPHVVSSGSLNRAQGALSPTYDSFLLSSVHGARLFAGSEQRERSFCNGAVRLTGVKGVSPPCEDFVDHVSVDIGQTSSDSVVKECELFMIESQQVQNGGIQIVD